MTALGLAQVIVLILFFTETRSLNMCRKGSQNHSCSSDLAGLKLSLKLRSEYSKYFSVSFACSIL